MEHPQEPVPASGTTSLLCSLYVSPPSAKQTCAVHLGNQIQKLGYFKERGDKAVSTMIRRPTEASLVHIHASKMLTGHWLFDKCTV